MRRSETLAAGSTSHPCPSFQSECLLWHVHIFWKAVVAQQRAGVRHCWAPLVLHPSGTCPGRRRGVWRRAQDTSCPILSMSATQGLALAQPWCVPLAQASLPLWVQSSCVLGLLPRPKQALLLPPEPQRLPGELRGDAELRPAAGDLGHHAAGAGGPRGELFVLSLGVLGFPAPELLEPGGGAYRSPALILRL